MVEIVVKGEVGTGANATALIIARGGKLNANGTATAPIIFTSVADEIEPGQICSSNFGAGVVDSDGVLDVCVEATPLAAWA